MIGTQASHEDILNFKPGTKEISYQDTLSDKDDFLHAIETGKPSLEPLEVGYNVYLVTMIGLISITMGSALNWDPQRGLFTGDNAATAMLTRPFRDRWLDSSVIEWMNKYQEIKLT